MSKITFDNLDKWLFNFHEGNLTSSEKRELQNFLDAHPELQEESDAWAYTKYSAPLTSIAFESELHAIAGAGVVNYRKWSVVASLLLLIGASTYFYFTNVDNFNFPNLSFNSKSNSTANSNNHDSSISSSAENGLNSNSNNVQTSLNNTINSNQTNSSIAYEANLHTSNTSNNLTNFSSTNLNTNKTTLVNANGSQNNNENRSAREVVTVDITNEIRTKIERETIIIYEDDIKKIIAETIPETEETKLSLELKLKNNNHQLLASENKSHNNKNKKKHRSKHNLDPNPTFTNLRDHLLLTTNNHLIEQHNGFAGNVIAPRFAINYRNNWTSTDINSQNAVFSYDQLLRKIKTGVALTAYYNNYGGGMFTTTGGALTISPKFKLGRGTTFEPAVTFSYSQKTVSNKNELTGRFIEDRRGNVTQLYRNGILPSQDIANTPDIKIGGLFQTKKFWAAATVNHILTPKEPLYGNENTHYINGMQFRSTIGTDYIHRPETGIVFSPQMTINHHDNLTELWGGINIKLQQFVIGGSFSTNKEFVILTGVKTRSFMFTYQYDMTKSYLLNRTIGSHELAMRFTLNGSKNGKGILNEDK